MEETTTRTSGRPDTTKADEALERLMQRGFTAFRNGRILIPDDHEVTPEEATDFETARGVYRNLKLI